MTEAALFRSLAVEPPPTLLWDEIDTVFTRRECEAQRGILNAGYERGTPVARCVGEGGKQEAKDFEVFGAKALAGIGQLPDTVADRSIPLRLERKAPGEAVERFRRRKSAPLLRPLHDQAAAWALEHIGNLGDAEPELPDELDDRAQDVCEPLLAIADLAGRDWPERSRRALVTLYGGRQPDDETDGVRLLVDIRTVFAGREALSTKLLLAGLNGLEEAPWGGLRPYAKEPGLDARGLAARLRSFRIRSRTVRMAGVADTAMGYRLDQFTDAFARYLPSNTGNTSNTSQPLSQRDVLDVSDVSDTRGGQERLSFEEAFGDDELERLRRAREEGR
jgi:Protein of unknown function (DUF3631)